MQNMAGTKANPEEKRQADRSTGKGYKQALHRKRNTDAQWKKCSISSVTEGRAN